MTAAEVHAIEAVLRVTPTTDAAAPGAAVTRELCGHWEHDGPCRWPHHTSAALEGALLAVRTVYVCAADAAQQVRQSIEDGLRAGPAPGSPPDWDVVSVTTVELTTSEQALGSRLAGRAPDTGEDTS